MLHLCSCTICSKVFKQIRDRITLALEFTGIKRHSSCRLRPYSHCMVNIIRSKSAVLDLFHGKISGQLMNNGGYHFQMRQFFCRNIIKNCCCHPVRSSKTLGKITQGSADLTVRATGVQYPIIAPQPQCLCGFAGFSIQEIMMSKDIFPDSLSYMICSTTLLIRFPFAS